VTHSNYKVIRATIFVRSWVKTQRAMKKDIDAAKIEAYVNKHYPDLKDDEREYVFTFCDPKPTPLFIAG